MSFIRSFSNEQLEKLTSERNQELFSKLKADISKGLVFPAIRKNEIYFYYKGGCLYKFSSGHFSRDSKFELYSQNTESLAPYEKAKKQIENKFIKKCGDVKERLLLNRLNNYTFNPNNCSKIVVLDIEVNLNGNIGGSKKCDLVLLNTKTHEIMFVEGKVFRDYRVNVKCGRIPEVIEQVNTYTQAVEEQTENILQQYSEHIRIINNFFDTKYNAPVKIIKPAKLLVYNVPLSLTENQSYSIQTINAQLGAQNVAWYVENEEPFIDEIWSALCK